MIFRRVFLWLTWFVVVDNRFLLYETNKNHSSPFGYDCLYAYINDDNNIPNEAFIRHYHLIPYCRRSEETDEMIESGRGERIHFNDLKKKGVTSTQLLEWFVPIDIVEQYEIDDENSDEIFYNCTSPWFGSMCQYTFDLESPSTFADIVNLTFSNRYLKLENTQINTCYPFVIGCYYGPALNCLDWREICNGRFDCLNGEDEEFCEELELNECNVGEYRCHYGGQCIPWVFVHDGSRSLDCLDGSDEQDLREKRNSYKFDPSLLDCNTVPTFFCEESSCRYPHSLSCGNGNCIIFKIEFFYMKQCVNYRTQRITRNLILSQEDTHNFDCEAALHCLLGISSNARYPFLSTTVDFDNRMCESLNLHCFSEWISIPTRPLLFGFFQLIYFTNRSIDEFKTNILPDLICFNAQHCPGLLRMIVQIDLKNNLTCCHRLNLLPHIEVLNFDIFESLFLNLIKNCLTIGNETECSHSSLFHCEKSMKCVHYDRIVDGYQDCYFNEDETYPSCYLNNSKRFQCPSNSSLCFSLVAIQNNFPDCPQREDEFSLIERLLQDYPIFSTLCQDIDQMQHIPMKAKECQLWPCDNVYNRCNGIWECRNGIDELNCPLNPCGFNQHQCHSYTDNSRICLSIEYLFESFNNDCLSIPYGLPRTVFYDNRTNIDLNKYLSWNQTKCITADKICRKDLLSNESICLLNIDRMYIERETEIITNNATYKCYNIGFTTNIFEIKRIHGLLKSSRFGYFPPISTNQSIEIIDSSNETLRNQLKIDLSDSLSCNRGIRIGFGLNKTRKCLCPPSYFGSECQWQNQRVSLTIQFMYRSTISNMSVFQIVIMLIDDQSGEITESFDQIQFISNRDCQTKFNINLLYPQRPKRVSANYSIRIDIFNKITLKYYGSYHLSINYSFLPVNRLSTRLFMPEIIERNPCSLLCGQHGECVEYVNKPWLSFCRCNQGYSDWFCNVTNKCHCSNGSICLSSSICVCPMDKFGRRCYLNSSITIDRCQHQGIYIPSDPRISLNQWTCLCQEGFYGQSCEINKTRIDIHFDQNFIDGISSIFIHFITAFDNRNREHITTFQRIPYSAVKMTFYVQQAFHLAFVELSNHMFYLIVRREIFIGSETIEVKLQSNQYCQSINHLLNETFLNYTQTNLMKIYPWICREYSQLTCFYDNFSMCICDLDRFSNCFLFNHSKPYDCQGENDCVNDGECFINNQTCPSIRLCRCKDCFYGSRCQFSSQGFLLSLDPILVYQIHPSISIHQQPRLIQITIGLIIVIMILELINAYLSIITFRMKECQKNGCGYYLLFSSIFSLLTISFLCIKFWILLLSQLLFIINRSFLTFNCLIFDGLIKSCLITSQWLNGCVSLERMIMTLQGIYFNKTQSKQIAKWIICIVIIFIILTNIHDPFHRDLIDDFGFDEKRTWCFIEYSLSFQIYNSIMNFFHFLVPLVVDLISSIVIIRSISRNRSVLNIKVTFRKHFRQQLGAHKHLLIAPLVQTVLSLPRLIIPFVNGCMKISSNSHLFLIAYLIPFISIMLTFITHILPSKTYTEQFRLAFSQMK